MMKPSEERRIHTAIVLGMTLAQRCSNEDRTWSDDGVFDDELGAAT